MPYGRLYAPEIFAPASSVSLAELNVVLGSRIQRFTMTPSPVLFVLQVTGTCTHVPEYDTLSCQLLDGRLVKAISDVLKACWRASLVTCMVCENAAPPSEAGYS